MDLSDLNIRTAKKEDWQRIIDIYNQSVQETGKTADTELQTVESRLGWLNAHLNTKHPILLAEKDNQIIGWCSLSPHRPGRKALQITSEISYYIDMSFRRMGVCTTIISYAIKYAREVGIKNIYAILLDLNIESINILERFGFEKWGHLPNVAELEGKSCGQYIYGKRIAGFET